MTTGALLLGATILLGASVACAFRAPRAWLAAVLAGATAAFAAAIQILAGGGEGVWEWRAPFALGGESVHLLLDGVSALFLALVAVVGAAGAAYSRDSWPDAEHPRSARWGRCWWSGMLLAIGAVLLAANGLLFLLSWEIFAVCGFALITLDARRREVRAAGWLYLAASHAGTLALFAFFALLAAATGSWELGPLAGRTELAPLFWLALFGFGVKAGMFPLHVWLPSAHANAPGHVSALLSGVALKIGVYGLVRFSGWLPAPAAAGWVVAALGVTSAVLGVAFALGQHDLKRLLAYHSVENIGIILIGLGFALIGTANAEPGWGGLALAAALFHVWNHGVFKALLFLGAGSVHHATGTREMSRLGGLWRAMPWTAACFGLGAAAIAGLPPLNGFVSEWLLYLGLFDVVAGDGAPALAAAPAIVLLAVTGGLALACFVKVCGVVFLGASRAPAGAPPPHEAGPWMKYPMAALAATCVALGLAPILVWPALATAVAAWRGDAPLLAPPVSLAGLGRFHLALAAGAALAFLALRRASRRRVRRALTWDCGFAAPTARMQYTAGSFAATLTDWFAWILRPERQEERAADVFLGHASRSERTPETVLERVIQPLARGAMFVSATVRRLQHGRVQAYVFYLMIGLGAVAALALAGGAP